LRIVIIDDAHAAAAADLLHRFFREEGFAGDRAIIAANLDALRRDRHHWAAAAINENGLVGIVSVTTMLYIEWGRLGEIGDLYVLPEERGLGIARALVQAAIAWCRSRGCSAVAVTITPEGEAAHSLSRFYAKFGFAPTGRASVLLRLGPG
jgi:GNAT superfamily N-acetyltransferase